MSSIHAPYLRCDMGRRQLILPFLSKVQRIKTLVRPADLSRNLIAQLYI